MQHTGARARDENHEADTRPAKRPRALPKNSPLLNSLYRPNVRATDRFKLWTSPFAILRDAANAAVLPKAAREKRFDAVFGSVEASTRATYGAGLLRFHEFCDEQGVEELQRVPASDYLLSAFVAHHLGKVGTSAVNNWVAGLQLWHTLQDAPWLGNRGLKAALKGVGKQAPASSTRPQRPPVTRAHLLCLRRYLDLTATMDSAVFATACMAFHGCNRLGELLVPSAGGFDAAKHVARSASMSVESANGEAVFGRVLIPWTKTTGAQGADIILTAATDDTCAVKAAQHHLAVNAGAPDDMPFFSWRAADGKWYPLTKDWFLKRCAAIWDAHGLKAVYGHSFRIGGTTDLLLRGLPPSIVAIQGRWSSRAFLRYWRKVEDIVPVFLTRASSTVTIESLTVSMARFEADLV